MGHLDYKVGGDGWDDVVGLLYVLAPVPDHARLSTSHEHLTNTQPDQGHMRKGASLSVFGAGRSGWFIAVFCREAPFLPACVTKHNTAS